VTLRGPYAAIGALATAAWFIGAVATLTRWAATKVRWWHRWWAWFAFGLIALFVLAHFVRMRQRPDLPSWVAGIAVVGMMARTYAAGLVENAVGKLRRWFVGPR